MKNQDELIAELVHRDQKRCYQLLVEHYAGFVFNACLNQVYKKEDAEDLTQEVFLAIHLNLNSYEGRSKISTWIYSIVLNKCKEFHRHHGRQKRKGIEQSIDDESLKWSSSPSIEFDHPGVQLEKKENAQLLFNAIDQLPENQKIAYTLNKIEGFSYAEVADTMKQSISAIESLIFRANKNLRNLLADYYQKNFQ